jgi:5-deoxy-glucuronate isomerase
MSELIVRPSSPPAEDGTLITVTPGSAGWSYVGFEALALVPGVPARRDTGEREVCIVVVSGTLDVRSTDASWEGVGGRPDPFEGMPEAVYLPPGTSFELEAAGGPCEVGLCFAPAREGLAPRLLRADQIEAETRGYGSQERTIHPILMGEGEAESLLVTEVQTPAGHWSSYPPHKHDRDALPDESYLEETYYHRVDPARGFVVQRVYTDDRSLDAALTVRDGDVVLVPRGYHPVGVPPGYRSYYLNVMAGPPRTWVFHNDPDHEWLMTTAPDLGD